MARNRKFNKKAYQKKWEPSAMVPSGMCLNEDGYLRIRRGLLRNKYAHRAYMERLLGRQLGSGEEVHHLCRNRQCWPPTDFHLLLLDDRLHHGIDGGKEPHRKHRNSKNRHLSEVGLDPH